MSIERLQNFLEKLLCVYSPSGEESAVAAVIKDILDGLGFSYYEDETKALTGSDSGNLIVGGDGYARVSFCAHMDTIRIYQKADYNIENNIVRAKDEGVIGLDDKAGIAVLLEALARMKEQKAYSGDVHFLFTTREEDGFWGAKHIDERHIKNAYNFVVDSGGTPIGYTVSRGASQYDFSIGIKGEMSHAGSPTGKNSLLLSAKLAAALHTGRLSDFTFLNISNLHCEGNPNTVPGYTSLQGQILSFDDEDAKQWIEKTKKDTEAFFTNNGCTGDISFSQTCGGFYTDENSAIVRYAQNSASAAGLSFRLGKTSTGSDAHIFAQRGAETVKISNGMLNVHSRRESVDLTDLLRCVDYVLSLAGALPAEH